MSRHIHTLPDKLWFFYIFGSKTEKVEKEEKDGVSSRSQSFLLYGEFFSLFFFFSPSFVFFWLGTYHGCEEGVN